MIEQLTGSFCKDCKITGADVSFHSHRLPKSAKLFGQFSPIFSLPLFALLPLLQYSCILPVLSFKVFSHLYSNKQVEFFGGTQGLFCWQIGFCLELLAWTAVKGACLLV